MKAVAIAGDTSPSLYQGSSTSRSAHQGSRSSSSTRDSKMSKKKSDNRKANKANKATKVTKVTKPSLGDVVKQGKSERIPSRAVEHLWHPDRPWEPFEPGPAFSDHGADTSDAECSRNTNSGRNVTEQTSQDARGS